MLTGMPSADPASSATDVNVDSGIAQGDAAGRLLVDSHAKRAGLWVMPDNRREVKLEDCLRDFVPPSQENLWTLAEQSARSALAQGASVREGDRSNAELYTWLAWQDAPGQQPGFAISQKVLDAHSSHAQPFVDWFRKLYDL